MTTNSLSDFSDTYYNYLASEASSEGESSSGSKVFAEEESPAFSEENSSKDATADFIADFNKSKSKWIHGSPPLFPPFQNRSISRPERLSGNCFSRCWRSRGSSKLNCVMSGLFAVTASVWAYTLGTRNALAREDGVVAEITGASLLLISAVILQEKSRRMAKEEQKMEDFIPFRDYVDSVDFRLKHLLERAPMTREDFKNLKKNIKSRCFPSIGSDA